jgi:hypothetical protein
MAAMRVYLVYLGGRYEDREPVGVYETLERAKEGDHGHIPKWSARGDYAWHCDWTLKHHRAKVPVTMTLEHFDVPVFDGKAVLPDGRVIHTTANIVRVPVPPSKEQFSGPIIDYTEDCGYSIEMHDVLT